MFKRMLTNMTTETTLNHYSDPKGFGEIEPRITQISRIFGLDYFHHLLLRGSSKWNLFQSVKSV